MTSDLLKDFEELKKTLFAEYGEEVGLKLYVQILGDCAKGVVYTQDDNPIAKQGSKL